MKAYSKKMLEKHYTGGRRYDVQIFGEPIPPFLPDPYIVQKKLMGLVEAHIFGLQIILMVILNLPIL